MAQQIHYSVVEAQNKSLGQSGSVFGTLTGETSQLFPSSGQTSTVIDSNAGAAATTVTFPQGMTIFGRWTTINLASGACIAYVG